MTAHQLSSIVHKGVGGGRDRERDPDTTHIYMYCLLVVALVHCVIELMIETGSFRPAAAADRPRVPLCVYVDC
jgi:hypothetical protein